MFGFVVPKEMRTRVLLTLLLAPFTDRLKAPGLKKTGARFHFRRVASVVVTAVE
jgi:hypothetical protein